MESLTVAPLEKFKALRALPKEFPVTSDISAVTIEPRHYEPLAHLITNDPDIQTMVTWASLVKGTEDIKTVLESRTQGTLLGRYVLELTGAETVLGSLSVFPGQRNKEYGFGGAFVEASQRGNGVTGKAGLALLKEVLRFLSPHHLYVQIAPENTASIAIAIKHGFSPAETVWDPDLKVEERRYRLELLGGQVA